MYSTKMEQYSNNTERYIRTLRDIADEMEMNMDMGMGEDVERGASFIRATEVHPFNNDKKNLVINLCTNLIEQHQIIKNSGGSIMQQLMPIEKLYTIFAEHPELISQHANFRKVVYNKTNEYIDSCNKKNIEVPQIISDMSFILKMLESRSDYVKDVPPLPTPTTSQDVYYEPVHNYNLRSKRYRTY